MAIAGRKKSNSETKLFRLCPFWQTGTNSSSSPSTNHLNNGNRHVDSPALNSRSTKTVSSVARSLLPPRRRLRLDPSKNLYFPYEPGKQVRSAIRLKNTSRSHVAFKFQTTAPKSCYMRPPGGILAPGESIIATVFKFVEHPENNEKQPLDQKSRDKFKIMSLKVKAGIDYVPELFDEQKDQVTVERILRVVFLDAVRPSPALEKLKRQLAEAEAALEARKRPPPDTGPRVVGEGLVIDEWKERREKYLARQQVEAVDSV
ncbi:vesicle-associated protein 4-1-like isoform X1 [Pistacia vera]|uniref:vesicle-associated protein 4-1-like isoform X1 n=2 Tax=Pistacia vera TaxID=55513 RepID=UPI001263024A|nr:vesicle-associated protein 4-1-like isoform X1 [Pistacia vera]